MGSKQCIDIDVVVFVVESWECRTEEHLGRIQENRLICSRCFRNTGEIFFCKVLVFENNPCMHLLFPLGKSWFCLVLEKFFEWSSLEWWLENMSQSQYLHSMQFAIFICWVVYVNGSQTHWNSVVNHVFHVFCNFSVPLSSLALWVLFSRLCFEIGN